MKIIEYATRPYPLSLNRWGTIISISLFISFFMLVFQPFGLHNLDSAGKSILLGGYGMVTFSVLVLDMIFLPILFPRFFREDKWTLLRQIIWLGWILISIAIGNYFYSDLLSIVRWVGIKGILLFIGFTLVIGILPIIAVTVLSYNRLLKKNLRASMELNQMIGLQEKGIAGKDKQLVISSENKNQVIKIPHSNLICLESEGNYVNASYLEEGRIHRILIRNTLKNVEAQIGMDKGLFKCHRAFIINLEFIEKVIGNSQGYRLAMKHLDAEIPVSRNFSKSFREAINNPD